MKKIGVGKRLFLLMFFLAFIFIGCTKEDPLLSTSVFPHGDGVNLAPQKSITINFRCTATNQEVRSFQVIRVSSITGKDLLLDSTINAGSLEYFYKLNHSGSKDSNIYQLLFKCTGSESGVAIETVKILELPDSTARLLHSHQYSIYTQPDARENAFSFKQKGVRYNPPLADSLVSFRDSARSDTLSHVWISPKGGEFLKYNSFNFNDATSDKIKSAYLLGNPANLVSNIKDGDVILYSEMLGGKRYYAAILVSQILTGGEKRYILQIKSSLLE